MHRDAGGLGRRGHTLVDTDERLPSGPLAAPHEASVQLTRIRHSNPVLAIGRLRSHTMISSRTSGLGEPSEAALPFAPTIVIGPEHLLGPFDQRS